MKINKLHLSITSIAIFALINILWIPQYTIASKKNISQRSNSSRMANKATYLTTPFNNSTEIPPNFLGHDLEAISNALIKRQESLKKDEFETTQAFNQRVIKEGLKPILGTINVDSTLAFVLSDKFESSYNADLSLFRIEIPNSDYTEFTWKSKTFNYRTYKASNAFGATIDVSSWDSESFSIKPDRRSNEQTITLSISSNLAKKLKENFGIIFISKIEGYSPVKRQIGRSNATFDNPYSISYSDTSLNVKILEFKIFDKTTGEVYYSGTLYPPINYTKLETLLKAQMFKEADEETDRVMLAVANRQSEGWLRKEDAEKFPCKELRTIDNLWLKYSQGKFGISVQQEIYKNLGGTKQFDVNVWRSFGDRVGWRNGILNSWLIGYSDLNFSLSAPTDHLPHLSVSLGRVRGGYGGGYGEWG
ncbi:GUN4 domain-containing protein, partial [Cylindrospermopsis raciborskii]|uniref:GUN4 domain-containing protein n=1 Tax=Cylindrospermopsis raciborskii TaxID=77022 RepID=UPI00215530C7